MKRLNFSETKLISGGLAKLSTGGVEDEFKITVTDQGKFLFTIPINGYVFDLIFYPDHVNDLEGNLIFSGNKGNFNYKEFSFKVSPTKGGAIYDLTNPKI